jgi:hypothetical protein
MLSRREERQYIPGRVADAVKQRIVERVER